MPPGIGYDDGALNDAALEQALGGAGLPPDPGMGGPAECPLCTGPVDPESGMTLYQDPAADPMGMPAGDPMAGAMPPGDPLAGGMF